MRTIPRRTVRNWRSGPTRGTEAAVAALTPFESAVEVNVLTDSALLSATDPAVPAVLCWYSNRTCAMSPTRRNHTLSRTIVPLVGGVDLSPLALLLVLQLVGMLLAGLQASWMY